MLELYTIQGECTFCGISDAQLKCKCPFGQLRTALADSGTAAVHQIPDNRCPVCAGILAKAIDEGADGTPVESADDHLEHGGHFFGCSKYRFPCKATADASPKPTEEMVERINEAMRRIGKMCSEGRPPRMSIPVRPDDDDVFICDTLRECRAALAAAPKGG